MVAVIAAVSSSIVSIVISVIITLIFVITIHCYKRKYNCNKQTTYTAVTHVQPIATYIYSRTGIIEYEEITKTSVSDNNMHY